MVMNTLQIRLSRGLVDKVDNLVETGIYANRSDVIRDAVRRLVINNLIGIISDAKDSVKEIKEIRKKLSKHKFDLDKINKLME